VKAIDTIYGIKMKLLEYTAKLHVTNKKLLTTKWHWRSWRSDSK